MATLKFKTNIKCDGCVAKVTPELNQLTDASWSVDLKDPQKILTVETDNTTPEQVREALRKAGYSGESI